MPDWEPVGAESAAEIECEAGCGTLLDPVLISEGWHTHPSCAFPELAVTQQMRVESAHAIKRRGKRPAVERRPQGYPQTLTSADDSSTQRAAASRALPAAGTRRAVVYDCIAAAGARGLCHEQLSAANGLSYSQNGPRVRELVSDGHVVRAPRTRETSTGSQQDVFVATINAPEGAQHDDTVT